VPLSIAIQKIVASRSKFWAYSPPFPEAGLLLSAAQTFPPAREILRIARNYFTGFL
jgi:hypothetical protein